jgi:hypothetical protein
VPQKILLNKDEVKTYLTEVISVSEVLNAGKQQLRILLGMKEIGIIYFEQKF